MNGTFVREVYMVRRSQEIYALHGIYYGHKHEIFYCAFSYMGHVLYVYVHCSNL